jgi:hypothetical protein
MKMIRWVLRFTLMGLVTVGVTGTRSIRAAEGATGSRLDAIEIHQGQMFPTMVFPSLDGGRSGSVTDFRGKKLILQIFASW